MYGPTVRLSVGATGAFSANNSYAFQEWSVLDAVSQLDSPCVVVAVTSNKCYANHDQV